MYSCYHAGVIYVYYHILPSKIKSRNLISPYVVVAIEHDANEGRDDERDY